MSGEPEIFAAVTSRNADAVRAALARDASHINDRNEMGATPVILTAYVGAPELADILIEHGAVVDVHAAAALGKTDRVLAQLDADPALLQAHSPDGWTPLHLAAFFNQMATARALLARGADVLAYSTNAVANQPMHAATAAGRGEMVAFLLEHGADVNAWAEGGYAPLHLAAGNGRLDLMELFVQRGAAINARRDETQMTPLGIAEKSGQDAAAAWLRERGGVL